MKANDSEGEAMSKHTTINKSLSPAALADTSQASKAHLRNNIVYHCCKFLQCDSEEPCE